jgi:hypothetical protein
MRSIAGPPREIPTYPQTISSLHNNSPAKTAVANFHGLYLERPNVMLLGCQKLALGQQQMPAIQPYLFRNTPSDEILAFDLFAITFRPNKKDKKLSFLILLLQYCRIGISNGDLDSRLMMQLEGLENME